MNKTKLTRFVVGLALCMPLCTLPVNVDARPIKPSSQKSADEPKGEVDKLVKELHEHNQPVVRGCLENCHEASATTAPKKSLVEIVNKVQPAYPPIARAAHASGQVIVMVVFDEEGKVVAAQVVSGHPLLQAASVKAAKETTFAPYLVAGSPVKVMGTITYNFIP